MTGMKDKPISSRGIVGGDVFILFCTKASNKKITDYLSLFDFNDYYCYKGTELLREVSYEDILEFKYSTYKFFKKNTHSKKYLDDWVKFCGEHVGHRSLLLSLSLTPFPPFPPSKIIVKQKPIHPKSRQNNYKLNWGDTHKIII
jgi:hypothetical protein